MEQSKTSENKYADVPLRVKTWVFIILVFTLGISHTIPMKFFISWIGFQVMFEFQKMFKIKGNILFFSIVVGATQFLMLLFFSFKDYFQYALLFFVVVVTIVSIRTKKRKKVIGVGAGLLLSLFVFSHLYFILDGVNGLQSLIFLVVVTELNDVFQYLMGKSFGKHKILPKISPNKTSEGFIGGVFLTVVLSNVLGYFLLDSTILVNTLLGIVLGVLGFFGDAFMSYIKRKTQVKDTGKLLPGHGGLLDRMDSLIFNTPVFFWVFLVFLKS